MDKNILRGLEMIVLLERWIDEDVKIYLKRPEEAELFGVLIGIDNKGIMICQEDDQAYKTFAFIPFSNIARIQRLE